MWHGHKVICNNNSSLKNYEYFFSLTRLFFMANVQFINLKYYLFYVEMFEQI